MSLDHDRVRQPQTSPKHSAPPALTHTDEAPVNQGGLFDPCLTRTAADILGLQRTIGNQATQHFLTGSKQPRHQPRSSDEIPVEDVMYEIVARSMAYKPEDEDGKVLRRQWGFQENLDEHFHHDRDTGFFMALMLPTPAGEKKGRRAVLMFRGSDEGQDWTKSNDDPRAVGYTPFEKNRSQVEKFLKDAGGKVDVVGHSLGGALAQHAAAAFPAMIKQVVTFQSPGVTAEQAKRFANEPKRPSVRHHIAKGDIADMAGEANLAGSVYEHFPRSFADNIPTAILPIPPTHKIILGGIKGGLKVWDMHTSYLLSDPAYSHHHKALGLTYRDGDRITTSRPTVRHEQYPYPEERKLAEGLRKGVRPAAEGLRDLRDLPGSMIEGLRDLPGSATEGLRDLIIEDLCRPYRNNPFDSESICSLGPRDNR